VIRFNQCGSGPTGCVIGHGGLNTGVDEAVLLEVPGIYIKFRFADPCSDSHQANAEVRHERDGIEYPFQGTALNIRSNSSRGNSWSLFTSSAPT
jgi:hypothetical protein